MIESAGVVQFRVVCDACGKAQPLKGVYVADLHSGLRNDAAKLGWVTQYASGVRDVCPNCMID